MIYVLYGQPGSGKTTLSQLLCTHIQHQPEGNEAVIIDGDKFRKLFKQTDYSTTGRENNITAANTVATYISQIQHVDVILALVNHIINTDSSPDDTWSVLKGLLFKPRRW